MDTHEVYGSVGTDDGRVIIGLDSYLDCHRYGNGENYARFRGGAEKKHLERYEKFESTSLISPSGCARQDVHRFEHSHTPSGNLRMLGIARGWLGSGVFLPDRNGFGGGRGGAAAGPGA